MRIVFVAIAITVIFGSGCGTVDDYLRDLETVSPNTAGKFELDDTTILFDEGQLAHEALAELTQFEEMQLWQAMRTLHYACEFLRKARDNALLQSDSAVLIGHIVSRFPVPPLSTKGVVLESNYLLVEKQFTALVNAREPLKTSGYILGLDSPDEVVKLEALEKLRDSTGQDFGRDAAAWRTWHETVRGEQIQSFIKDSREPLEKICNLEYVNTSEASTVLGVLALWVKLWGHRELEDLYIPGILKVARQAAIHSLSSAILLSKHPQVRADVADAMSAIRDIDFGGPLAAQLQRERDPHAASKIIQALRHYPARQSIERIIEAMSLGDPQVLVNAVETLSELTGQRFDREPELWADWWRREGAATWR